MMREPAPFQVAFAQILSLSGRCMQPFSGTAVEKILKSHQCVERKF
jgi:hypothetical protein